MSYNVTLGCSCRVYVSVDPRTEVAHTRVIESRGEECRDRHHDVGVRLRSPELMPDERSQSPVVEHVFGTREPCRPGAMPAYPGRGR
jgi:hypothetical protein